MSWKSFACVAALSALITSPALAVPSLAWVDNGGSVTLQVTPSGTGSVALEVAATFTDVIDAAVIADAVSFDTANPGANPFTGGTTNGLYTTELGSGNVFAAYGSIVFNSATPVDFLTLDYSADGTFSVSSLVAAEGGVITAAATPADIMVTVPPTTLLGDADGDGDVDGDDLIAVQTNFGSVTPPPGDADGDGDVDGDDLIAVQTNFGNTLPAAATAAAVPEPTSAILLGLALVGFAARRNS